MNTDLRVKLASFEGPLDLLLYLIQKDEINIHTVKIAEITDQYLRTLDLMRDYNLDIAGDFLLMASTLIWLKSKTLLPSTDELQSDDPEAILTQEELMRRLMEHQRYRAMALDFKALPRLGEDFFARPLPPDKMKKEQLLKEMNLSELTKAFQNFLMKERSPVVRVKTDRMSIADAAKKIANRLGSQELTEFQSLFAESADRNEIVVTFLAILELGRLQKIRVLQHLTYGTIYVVLRDKLNYETMLKLFESGDSYAYRSNAGNNAPSPAV
ncbi:MAG: segregation/condensation protein A [Oligoflexia bacterium]|nr:segregation/condensation protein A [Oligoflexia bacterium]